MYRINRVIHKEAFNENDGHRRVQRQAPPPPPFFFLQFTVYQTAKKKKNLVRTLVLTEKYQQYDSHKIRMEQFTHPWHSKHCSTRWNSQGQPRKYENKTNGQISNMLLLKSHMISNESLDEDNWSATKAEVICGNRA